MNNLSKIQMLFLNKGVSRALPVTTKKCRNEVV